jgi:hypothetical protein
MARRALALILLLLTPVTFTSGCAFEHTSAPTSPSTPTATTGSSSSSYVGTWASATPVASLTADKCGNFQWKIASQTATAISGDFSAVCGAFTISATGSGQLSGQDVALTVNGSVSGGGLQACAFSLTGTGTMQGDTLPLHYSGTTCLGPVSGTETLRRGGSATPVAINAPAPVSPAGNVVVGSPQPTLLVTNATRTGPAGSIAYVFQVTQDVAFVSNVLEWRVPEASTGQTALTVPQALSAGATYFWRVQAYDPSASGPWSAIQTFRTPTTSPTGPAAGDQLDISHATIVNSPRDLASWPATTSLQVVDMRPDGISVQFSKKEGAGRWPDVTPPGWGGPLQYTLGMCLWINNQWYCSAVVEFWYGLDASGGPPDSYATNWFYDPVRWTPMTGHQPAVGETIGIFVCEGDCRNNANGTLSPLRERSNVVLVKQPSSAGATYRF